MNFKAVITDCLMPDTGMERSVISEIGAQLVRAFCKTPSEVLAVARDADALMVKWAPVPADVIAELNTEPLPAGYALLELPNVIATPHSTLVLRPCFSSAVREHGASVVDYSKQ